MIPFRRNALLAITLLFGLWFAPFLRAVNEEEAQVYERGAMKARERANEVMRKAEDANGEASALFTKMADNLKALAETKVKIAQKIRAKSRDGLDELKKDDEDFARKAFQIREQLREIGVVLLENPGGNRMMWRTKSREQGVPSEGETVAVGFRPRETVERKPGVVVLNSSDELRNWLDEEEARGGGTK